MLFTLAGRTGAISTLCKSLVTFPCNPFHWFFPHRQVVSSPASADGYSAGDSEGPLEWGDLQSSDLRAGEEIMILILLILQSQIAYTDGCWIS